MNKMLKSILKAVLTVALIHISVVGLWSIAVSMHDWAGESGIRAVVLHCVMGAVAVVLFTTGFYRSEE